MQFDSILCSIGLIRYIYAHNPFDENHDIFDIPRAKGLAALRPSLRITAPNEYSPRPTCTGGERVANAGDYDAPQRQPHEGIKPIKTLSNDVVHLSIRIFPFLGRAPFFLDIFDWSQNVLWYLFTQT